MSTSGTYATPDYIKPMPATGNGHRSGERSARRPLSRGEVACLIAVPLLWGILLMFHPGGEADQMYETVRDEVTPWLAVHIGMMFFIPLMAAVVYVLLRGVGGTAARVSRIALVPFALFYTIWEALQGIATGILVYNVNQLPATERATGSDLVQDFGMNILARDFGIFGSIGSVAFLVAMIAAALALHRHAGAPLAVPILLGLAGFLITAHPPPFGPTGLGLFIVAVIVFARSQSASRGVDPVVAPEAA
jgi:hypothetical protein